MEHAEVFKFWFGDGTKPQMQLWFTKNDGTDKQIRDKFGPILEKFDMIDFESWKSTPEGHLSLVVLLDQFPRNAYRGTPKSFEYDNDALEVAREALDKGLHDLLPPHQAMFLLLPFEHSEDITDQRESVRLFEDQHTRLASIDKKMADETLDYAKRHMKIIEKFGRFPHRNIILGRESTREELEFLKTPGSGF